MPSGYYALEYGGSPEDDELLTFEHLTQMFRENLIIEFARLKEALPENEHPDVEFVRELGQGLVGYLESHDAYNLLLEAVVDTVWPEMLDLISEANTRRAENVAEIPF